MEILMGLKFSPRVKDAYPKDKDPKIFGEIEKLYANALKYLLPELRAADVSEVAKVPHKTKVLLQVGLRRAIELTEATVRELNSSAFIPPFVTARATLETASVMLYTGNRVKSVVDSGSPTEVGKLDDDVLQLLMGTRAEGWGGEIQAKNILTIMGNVDKFYKGVRQAYEDLSEFAHPNYTGMLATYQHPDLEERKAIFVDPWKENTNILPMLLTTVALCLAMITYTLREFGKRLPDFIRLCEEEIYQRGKWPQEIPYRWGP